MSTALPSPAPVELAAETAAMSYREALRLALAEELERDERVFLMGDGGRALRGLLQGLRRTAGALWRGPRPRHADLRGGIRRRRDRGGDARERPVVEIMTLNFILVAMDQIVNHAAKIGAMFGGQVRCPLVIRTPNGAGNQLTAQHSQLRGLVCRHAGPQGPRARHSSRRQGPAQGSDP